MNRIYNCHTHVFNIENAPEKFLSGFVGKVVSTIAWPILNIGISAFLMIKLLKLFKNRPILQKYASFLKVGTMKSQLNIFKDLKSFYNPDDHIVILSLNMDYMGAGKAKHNYKQQIHEIKRIKAHYPDTCLPFYSIDPRAGSPGELLSEARQHLKKKGFVGIKIYPALGYYPFDPGLEEVYKWASDKKVPIMTHCTKVGSYYLGDITAEMINPNSFVGQALNWPNKFDKVSFPITENLKKKKEFCDNFSHLYNYARVLEKYPDLKICFAHAGDDVGIKEAKSGNSNNSWFTHIKYLMQTYQNVYTDISYTLVNKKIHKDLYELLIDQDIGHKVLFGTDYFMTLRDKSEAKLKSEFMTFLIQQDTKIDLWDKLANKNPKQYLTSNFYNANL